MDKKIEGSIVADNSSTISNVSNENNKNININKIKRDSIIAGFILGVVSSIIASYIYDFLKHLLKF